MSRRRTDLGLHIITNGKDMSERVMPWQEFMERVHKAALKPKRKPTPASTMTGATEEPPWLNDVPPERRCSFVFSKGPRKGHRCKLWSMRGARRCMRHGGYREVPEHPATVRRLGDIMTRQAAFEAGAELRGLPDKARAIVEATLKDHGLPTRVAVVLEGVKAYLTEDNGRAWRRWVKHAKQAKPSDGKQARKAQTRTKTHK